MGVGRESARDAITRSINELNGINEILSSDTDDLHQNQSIDTVLKRVRRKKRPGNKLNHSGNIYNCKKSNDIFLKELASELGIDPELQDITPSHNSPLSSLFGDPDKMKIWLVFIDSAEDVQDKMLSVGPEAESKSRYKKISKSIRAELENVSCKTIKQFEEDIYSIVSDMGYNSVAVMSAATKADRMAIVAISQYSRLKCTSHLPINVVEVELKRKHFTKPSVPLSKLLLLRH
ncbi:uncharacterized protein LOC134820626 [Bolinopsis microptera]|uniref:uncharacterized protein LOC134820626 n=1 Tax=Bolinopsis microptera TaxID=2820187 RepID=UPI003078D1CA